MPGTHRIGGSRRANSVDETYRKLEEAGAARARLAERDGLPAAAARNLKITNMHDSMREGDVAAVREPPRSSNPTTQFMAMAEQRGLRYGFGGGMGLTPAAGSPPMRVAPPIQTAEGAFMGPGHIGLRASQLNHAANVASVVAGGRRMPGER